jgi:hypothetical protein
MMIARNTSAVLVAALGSTFFLTGCELAKGIFKAGVWVGVLAVLGVILLAVFGIRALLR